MSEQGELTPSPAADPQAAPPNIYVIQNAYFGGLPQPTQAADAAAPRWRRWLKTAGIWGSANVLALSGVGIATSVQECGTYMEQVTKAADTGLSDEQVNQVGSWLTHQRCGSPPEVLDGRDKPPTPQPVPAG